MDVLVVNAGSSSVKLSVVDGAGRVLADHHVRNGPGDGAVSLGEIVAGLPPAAAVGHRVVHGGTEFTSPVLVTPTVRQRLGALGDLAPLHQGPALEYIDAARNAFPNIPSVACFDTAFHAGLPPAAATYALPAEWRRRYPLRRFGFHGLSHAYASRRATELNPGLSRLVVCHLGSGASLAAVVDGRCVDTTMGFTPLEGLVMSTRSGSVDPGLVLWLIMHAGIPATEVADGLELHSGLAGLAGTPDMAEVVHRAEGDDDAALALDVYLHRLRAGIAAMVASLGGIDGLVFTGGVGEAAPTIRTHTVAGLDYLGVAVDERANERAVPDAGPADADITADGSRVAVLVIRAREDVEVARGVRAVLASKS